MRGRKNYGLGVRSQIQTQSQAEGKKQKRSQQGCVPQDHSLLQVGRESCQELVSTPMGKPTTDDKGKAKEGKGKSKYRSGYTEQLYQEVSQRRSRQGKTRSSRSTVAKGRLRPGKQERCEAMLAVATDISLEPSSSAAELPENFSLSVPKKRPRMDPEADDYEYYSETESEEEVESTLRLREGPGAPSPEQPSGSRRAVQPKSEGSNQEDRPGKDKAPPHEPEEESPLEAEQDSADEVEIIETASSPWHRQLVKKEMDQVPSEFFAIGMKIANRQKPVNLHHFLPDTLSVLRCPFEDRIPVPRDIHRLGMGNNRVVYEWGDDKVIKLGSSEPLMSQRFPLLTAQVLEVVQVRVRLIVQGSKPVTLSS